MATYNFETISAADALTFTTSDVLIFNNPASSGNKTSVIFTAQTFTTPASVTVTDLVTGRTVVFGPGIAGEGDGATTGQIVFLDGSNLFIGKTTADSPAAAGTALNDGLF